MGKQGNRHQGQVEGEQKKEEKSNGGGSQKSVVLKVYIHCKGCSDQIFECLRGFDGVEEISIDDANNKVTVKGKNVDPAKVLARLQRKFSRNVELISPKQEPKKDKEEPKKEKPPQMKTIVLKMNMHCEGCVQDIKKNIGRMTGIMQVEPDMQKSLVTVKGLFDPPKLVKNITDQLGKHVEIVKQESQGKANDQKQRREPENVISYPPEYQVKYVYSSLAFSDENVFSCSIM